MLCENETGRICLERTALLTTGQQTEYLCIETLLKLLAFSDILVTWEKERMGGTWVGRWGPLKAWCDLGCMPLQTEKHLCLWFVGRVGGLRFQADSAACSRDMLFFCVAGLDKQAPPGVWWAAASKAAPPAILHHDFSHPASQLFGRWASFGPSLILHFSLTYQSTTKSLAQMLSYLPASS